MLLYTKHRGDYFTKVLYLTKLDYFSSTKGIVGLNPYYPKLDIFDLLHVNEEIR